MSMEMITYMKGIFLNGDINAKYGVTSSLMKCVDTLSQNQSIKVILIHQISLIGLPYDDTFCFWNSIKSF